MSSYNKGVQDQGTTRPRPNYGDYREQQQYDKGRNYSPPPPPPPRPVTIIKKD